MACLESNIFSYYWDHRQSEARKRPVPVKRRERLVDWTSWVESDNAS